MKDLLRSARAKTRLERRLFLKAIGLGLAAPVAWKLARSASAQSGGAQKRFLLFYVPHGVPPEHFNPVGEGSNFGLTESGVGILGPLEPYKSLVNVYEGFNYPGATTHEGIVKFLSNFSGENNDDTTPRTSIEHLIGNGLGVQTLALGAVPHRQWGQDFDSKLLWDGTAVVPQKNPLVAYDSLFGALGTGGAPPPDTSTQDELFQSLLTLNEGEIQALGAEVQSLTSESSKLTTHLEAIQSLRTGSGGGAISCTEKPALPAVDALRAKAAGQTDEWFLQEVNFPDILAAHLEVAAAALVCNAAPVVAVQSLYANCDIDFGFMGSAGAHHSGLSHTGPSQIGPGAFDLATREPYANAQRWFFEKLVEHVITRLDVPDPAGGTGTVLDNTIILYASEIGEGSDHTSATREILRGAPPGVMSYMPIVTIGSGGGGLVTGQRLNHWNESMQDRPAGDVWLTLARAMGLNLTEVGGATSAVTEALA